MITCLYNSPVSRIFVVRSLLLYSLLCRVAHAVPSALGRRADAAEDIPPYDAGAIRDPKYLPAQIGGIVGSYAFCLVLVAAVLLSLSRRRREHLTAGINEAEFVANVLKPQPVVSPASPYPIVPYSPRSIPRSPVSLQEAFVPLSPFSARALSVKSEDPAPYVYPSSPASTTRSPLGFDETVDQRVVAKDRVMAQSQLEEMYKYAFEHEEAKKKGMALEAPPIPSTVPSTVTRPSTAGATISSADRASTLTKKKFKPAHLDLSGDTVSEKHQSRASSILSALRSPRKKGIKGINISSPIMTPMSGTFPRESQEMNTIPPREYAPAAPPPVPTNQAPFRGSRVPAPHAMPLTPDSSPTVDGTRSIDERISGFPTWNGHSRTSSAAPTEPEANSAVSEHSQSPLVGLPLSPKPGVNRFPSLPTSPKPGVGFAPMPMSPKPGVTFQRPNAPTAVRTGGSLPLRAYEPSLVSPSMASTKQTVFERLSPMSPGLQTPFTGAAVPYSPYQPFSPCVPVTPSLVTKADRKRMKKLEPKTPTVEMVRSSEDIW